MSTAKRLVLSLRGRKESQSTAGTSSTRLVSGNSTSPGHELDEIAIVSTAGNESGHISSYGSLSLGGHTNGPKFIPGKNELFAILFTFFVLKILKWLNLKIIRNLEAF